MQYRDLFSCPEPSEITLLARSPTHSECSHGNVLLRTGAQPPKPRTFCHPSEPPNHRSSAISPNVPTTSSRERNPAQNPTAHSYWPITFSLSCHLHFSFLDFQSLATVKPAGPVILCSVFRLFSARFRSGIFSRNIGGMLRSSDRTRQVAHAPSCH